MNWFKRFWITFLSFLPLTAGAAVPWIIGGVAGIGAVAGFSIYRSFVPVDMAESLSFFSSCWSCQMFGDIMSTLSGLIPRVYSSIGLIMMPVAVGLMIIWIAWTLLSGYIKGKPDNAWSLTGKFGTKLIKLTAVLALLAFPLPRLISDVIVEPVFNVGFSLGRAINTDFNVGTVNENQFETCLVATAIADPAAASTGAARSGAFSPKLRHNLSCQLAGVHQMTALGMTAGWAMLNMSFSNDYMHKIMWDIPFFPNVVLFLAGGLVLLLFFFALLPIPLYLLEVFISLAIDLVMLPLFLLSWLFEDWNFIKTTDLKTTINNLIQGVVGIAMVGVFISFSILLMNAIVGGMDGLDTLFAAFTANDPTILMDGLLMNNGAIVSLVLTGLFLALFMSMTPSLIKTLFGDRLMPSQKFYDNAKNDLKTIRDTVQKWYKTLGKKQ